MTHQRTPRITRIGAYGLVVGEQAIVLCRVSLQIPDFVGQWTLPGGGIAFGEDPADGMVREVYEETGLRVRPTGLAGIDSWRHDGADRVTHNVRIIYFTERLGGSLRDEVDGSTDRCQWWSVEDTRTLPLVDLAEVGVDLAFPRP